LFSHQVYQVYLFFLLVMNPYVSSDLNQTLLLWGNFS